MIVVAYTDAWLFNAVCAALLYITLTDKTVNTLMTGQSLT